LERSQSLDNHPNNIEHVTHYIRQNPQIFKTEYLDMNLDPFDRRISLTVDTLEDLEFCNNVANALACEIGFDRFDFTTNDVFRIIKKIISTHKEK
jgi:spore coat polysaccharide biosynthesis protein SpsF (cytidylyltransferase family)